MRTLAAVVFPGFQTLDYFGPVEMFGWLPAEFDIRVVAEQPEPISSRNGQQLVVDHTFDEGAQYDMVLVPGGPGTPIEKRNPIINQWLREVSANAQIVMGVCTGSALLGVAGVLDGLSATTNKIDFDWTLPYAPDVNWVREARWIEDGKFFTSSGVSAGMDMSLAVIARLLGDAIARDVARNAEYIWNSDPTSDPFVNDKSEHRISS